MSAFQLLNAGGRQEPNTVGQLYNEVNVFVLCMIHPIPYFLSRATVRCNVTLFHVLWCVSVLRPVFSHNACSPDFPVHVVSNSLHILCFSFTCVS